MATKRDIDDFLAQKRIAFVGASRSPKAFSDHVYRALRNRGYQLFPVNPNAQEIRGDHCYPSVGSLPEGVDTALLMVPPRTAEEVVRQCAAAGIRRIWLGNGVASPEAVRFCQEQGIAVVDGFCPMMFAEPVSFGHACHRFVKRITGSLPK